MLCITLSCLPLPSKKKKQLTKISITLNQENESCCRNLLLVGCKDSISSISSKFHQVVIINYSNSFYAPPSTPNPLHKYHWNGLQMSISLLRCIKKKLPQRLLSVALSKHDVIRLTRRTLSSWLEIACQVKWNDQNINLNEGSNLAYLLKFKSV